MTHSQKPQLRKTLLQIRQSLTEDEVKQKSQAICQRIAELELFQNAQNILVYYPHNNEVNLLPLIKAYPEKIWYLPRLESENEFIALPFSSAHKLRKNQYGIPEPLKADEQLYENKLELVIIPGLGFDQQGNRLGMGKGYYDRYLKKVQGIFKIGVCFYEQRVDQIPTDPYDVSVDLVVTDQKY